MGRHATALSWAGILDSSDQHAERDVGGCLVARVEGCRFMIDDDQGGSLPNP